MSDELKDILCPDQEIPWDEAAAFFVVTKEATEQPQMTPVQEAKLKGAISGVRSATSSDITHASRIRRTRGERSGKNVGTAAGSALGYLAGRAAKGGGWKSRAAGTAIGAALGGGAGKTIGLEADRKRIIKKYSPKSKAKKAEMEKQSTEEKPSFLSRLVGTDAARKYDVKKAMDFARAQQKKGVPGYELVDEGDKTKKASITRVRELWKLAEGEPLTEGEQGPAGATPSPQAVEPGALTNERVPKGAQKAKAPKAGGSPKTPEQLDQGRSQQALQQEAEMDGISGTEEAEYYRQLLEQTSAEKEELGAALEQTQGQADQAGQQAQMVQMQADQAVQQASQQAQMSAQEKQQLSMQLDGAASEALQGKENLMQMRQAMQSYRENLQDIVLQDPTAAVGPSPEEQGMPPAGEGGGTTPGQMQSMMADQQMQKEEQQSAQGNPPPGTPAPPPSAAPELAAAAGGGGAPPAPKKAAPKKKEKEKSDKPSVTVNVEKKSSAIPELLRASLPFDKTAANWKHRAVGAAIGAPLAAGIQSISDQAGKGGVSKKERTLRESLKELKGEKGKGALGKHQTNITRALYETAKTNREHPRSAAAMAAVMGGITGASVGPSIGKGIKGVLQRVARGGK